MSKGSHAVGPTMKNLRTSEAGQDGTELTHGVEHQAVSQSELESLISLAS